MIIDLAQAREELKNDKFKEFTEILLKYNEMYNLTAICEEKEIYLKHYLDSILPQNYFFEGANVVEIGSGAGFPSIPLKIVRDDLKFTLIESTGKKCNFLNAAVDKLGLDCVKVMNIRAEEGGRAKELREKFDIAVARAVARLNTLCEYCLPFVKKGGRFIAYKGSDGESELEEALGAISVLGGAVELTETYNLPEDGGKRTVIIIKKVGATPSVYPRGRGLERKRPIK